MLLSYKPLHLEAQQRLQEEGCVVDINAAEVGLMAEAVPAVPYLPCLDLSTPYAVERYSTIENRLDVGVILFVHVLRRVQVKSVGVSGVKDDEDGAPATAQNKYTSN